MAAVVQASDLADLVAGTLYQLGRGKYQQIAQTRQAYEIFTRWFKKEKVMLDGGIGIQRTLMNRLPDAAAHVGLGAPDNVAITDLVDQLQVPWVHAQTSWGVIYQETLMNQGESLVYNIIKPRREGAMINLIELIESRAWQAPATSSDKLNPYGIPYWVVKNSSSTPGFNGGAASGHTTVAGVSLTDSPTFKNYTFTYALSGGMSKTDAIPKMRTMLRKCNYRSPVPGSDYSSNVGRYALYVNGDTTEDMNAIGEAQNENLGRDIANPMYGAGQQMFRGFEVRWVPELDADTANPVYALDHSTFMVAGLKGNWFRESRNNAPMQHNIEQYFEEVSYNYLCVDRRRNGVGYGV
jgi:hypothetical protein